MSNPAWKGYKKGSFQVLPTDKQVKHKQFRSARRIVKQYLRNYPGSGISVMAIGIAKSQLRLRQDQKRQKVEYFNAGNRHLHELPRPKSDRPITKICITTPPVIGQ